jgi:hypothetical protein
MTTSTTETQDTGQTAAAAEKQAAPNKANGRAQKPRVTAGRWPRWLGPR